MNADNCSANQLAQISSIGEIHLQMVNDPTITFPLKEQARPLHIGSGADCDIVLNDPTVSRRHAWIRKVGERWLLQDLGSTNGTQLNSNKINRATLRGGDQIVFGRTAFLFRDCPVRILDRILTLEPYQFEQLTGKLFAKLGFDAEVTRQTGDDGVDIVAIHKGVIFRGRYLVQCKRYKLTHRVTRPEIQAFHGRLAMEPRARGIFVTTSSFTQGARKAAMLTGINLIDGSELEILVEQYRL